MSTLKMQESIPDSELTQLRKQATHKDNGYATLENELFKKNNDLLAMKRTLDDAVYKLRNEADRAHKLESDLNRRSEDLRAERLARQNLEASLHSASDKLKSEELTSKHLEMELETYASRTTSQHQGELTRLQNEKKMLETRVRTLESQSQASKPSQLPTRLPRPTTFSGAASSASDARIAVLESELSKATHELADVSRALLDAQQEVAKLPRLQSKLITAENAQLRAERLASAETTRADNLQESLRERDEELGYWRDMARDNSVVERKIEDITRERDDAVKREEEIRWREATVRTRLEEMEEKETELVMEREEALDALHRLQAESNPTSGSKQVEDNATIKELRATIAERETTLLNAREYTAELHQMYRDTLDACEDAETRLRNVEREHEATKRDEPPLIIVTPPASPSPAAPFLVQAQPAAIMSAADEAVVARLLNAIERLRSERDTLRRDLHFAQMEHRMVADALRTRLAAAECEDHPLSLASPADQDGARSDNDTEVQKLKDESERWQCKATEAHDTMVARSAELEACRVELENVRVQAQRLEETTKYTATSQARGVRIALSSLVAVQHLQSNLEVAGMSNEACVRKCNELAQIRDQLTEAHGQAETSLLEAVQAREISISTQEFLREALVSSETRLSDALQVTNDRDSQMADIEAQLKELQNDRSALEQELADARAELDAAEERHSEQQLSALASTDAGAAMALKAQLEVLEQRVLRRTEQIGIQQHDIKRLETNLRVAEDTIGELTMEVETLTREKACLVEDCAQARETRDGAYRRVEVLEVEVETLAKEQNEAMVTLQDAYAEVAAGEERIEALICVVADSVTKSKAANAELTFTAGRLATIEADFHATEANHSHARADAERLASELELKILKLEAVTVEVAAITHELTLAREENQRVSTAFETLKQEVQSREDAVLGQTDHLTATLEDLEGRLAAAQASEDALSEELETAKHAETALQSQLIKVQEDSKVVKAEAERLSLAVTSLEDALEAGRLSHSENLELARQDFETRVVELEERLEERQVQHMSLQTNHARVVEEFNKKVEELEARLSQAHARAASSESLDDELRHLKTEHAEEILVLRSQLDESLGQIESLQAQLNTAADTIQDFESDLETSTQRYEAAQVEIRGLENALAGTRAQLDEHDASIQALQREKTMLQGDHTLLQAELEKSVTKYQYLEQQARRSDLDIVRLKADIEHLRTEAVKFDEAAQKAELSLSFKTVQFEQKLAMVQRDLKKQQEHRQCQESIAELNEKNEYLEEMLRMKSVEIEENDDRFIEALKEKKRLTGKVESMTRKVQSLQTKLAAITTKPSPPTATALPASRPKTPSPPIPLSTPSAGLSTRPPTRIPSSPAAALRAKTPEPSRRPYTSRLATPEPPVPALPQTFRIKTPERLTVTRTAPQPEHPSASHVTPPAAPSTPLSSGSRKRRAPDDFDSPTPIPAQVVVAPSLNLTPRHLRRPTNEGRSGFTPTRNGNTPTRNGNAAPMRVPLTQPSPLRRVTAPLSEMTNSPRVGRTLGLGKPTAASKQPMRSWLSRSRPPTGGIDL